ncbi:MAG: glycosyltransferase family A protein [Myxococcota bacterium]|nr:glycosyltransferase family A protein [Myxococcota bacterium]
MSLNGKYPSVAVIIPTFNRATLLERAVRSVIAQTVLPAEIWVIDDGSTDETEGMLRANFPGVHYRYQENRGVSAARNMGIEEAESDWIALLDSDDAWQPEKLERQLRALSNNPEVLFLHTDEIWMRRGKRVNPMNKHAKPNGRVFKASLALCAMSPSSALIHRRVFDDVGLFDESLPACEDYDLWLRISSKYDVLLVPEPLVVKYGGHEDQLSRKHWGMDRFRVKALEKILKVGAWSLTLDERTLALKILREKLTILRNGAAKRGNDEQSCFYETKLAAWNLKATESR